MWSGTKPWDPEGLISAIPAIASMLFGVLNGAGRFRDRKENQPAADLTCNIVNEADEALPQ